MKKIVEYTQTELDKIITEYEVLKKEAPANRWTAILAILCVFGCFGWINYLHSKNMQLEAEKSNLNAVCKNQKEYFESQIQNLTFHNEMGRRIVLTKKNVE